MPATRTLSVILSLILLAGAASVLRAEPLTEEDYDAKARQVVPRDRFPVLFDPPMKGVREADEALEDDELVIGVFLGGKAKAYPVQVMGVHELVNDVCGEVPIAASW